MIAVAGATGVLGSQIVAALARHEHSIDETILFASERSRGQEVEMGSDTLAVETVDFKGVDLVFIATPMGPARTLISEAQKAGCRIVDFSGAFRADRSVPLVVPGVSVAPNDWRMLSMGGAASIALGHCLAALKSLGKLSWVDVVALYGASHRGHAGITALEKQTASLLSGKPVDSTEPFAHTLAFNVIPQVEAFSKGHPNSADELAISLDMARGVDAVLPVHATALHVPVFHGLFLNVHAQAEKQVEADQVQAAFRASSSLKLLDSADEAVYPTMMLTAGDEAVHVGRVRALGTHLWWSVAVDGAVALADAAVRLALAN